MKVKRKRELSRFNMLKINMLNLTFMQSTKIPKYGTNYMRYYTTV